MDINIHGDPRVSGVGPCAIVHPCHMVPHCLQFPPLPHRADKSLSTPALTTPANSAFPLPWGVLVDQGVSYNGSSRQDFEPYNDNHVL